MFALRFVSSPLLLLAAHGKTYPTTTAICALAGLQAMTSRCTAPALTLASVTWHVCSVTALASRFMTCVLALASWLADMRAGILWQPGAAWIGVHYSPYCQRWCINVVPFVTLWVAKPGGKIPHSTR